MHCPAKVNFALSVGSPQASTGMHPIASWMAALSFGDDLEVSVAARGPSTFDIAFVPDDAGTRGLTVDWPLEKDLVWRAHQLIEREAGRELPVNVRLRKRIPTGAGLGGGSSDGAAMLVALRDLFAVDISEDRLMAMAAQLGSDVPVLTGAMLGRPQAVVTGLGGQVQPIDRPPQVWLVLVLPGLSCPTGPVYAAFDRRLAGREKTADRESVSRAASCVAATDDLLFNDLAAPACDVAPDLAKVIRAVEQLDLQPHITGSGSTVFVLVPDEATGQSIARRITDVLALPTIVTRTLAPSESVV